MNLIIGVTGTRNGMNNKQKEIIQNLLEKMLFVNEYEERILHHGQCVGVDVQFAKLLKNRFGFYIHSHPPVKTDLLGISENDCTEKPKSYFARNRDIVDSSSILFVIPKENSPQNIGGTWYTYHYAKKNKKQIIVIYPNGAIEQHVREVLTCQNI